jgi:anaerobic ribonucleoside-triphosphate reductase activating protein
VSERILNLAHTEAVTEAEGPGRRFAIWFQGCPLRCAACCNPEMLPFDGGHRVGLVDLVGQIAASRERGVEGVTLLGGEPFAHANEAAELAMEVQSLGLSVMVFSGYTIEELERMSDLAVGGLLKNIDILVDGPYARDQPELSRRWVGSSNQRVHFLTQRYHQHDPCWNRPNTIEIRLSDGELRVNGFPDDRANAELHLDHETRGERAREPFADG